MLRRHTAIALLVLAAQLGAGGPAAAEAGPRDGFDPSARSLELRPRIATTAPSPGSRIEPADTEQDPWVGTIARRLEALAAAARDHAAERPEHAATTDALLERLRSLATTMHEDAALGIAVRDLSTGAPVFEWDASRSLNPASNHKLLTAVAALELLGADYRWQTQVLRRGDQLVLVGEGDPSLQVGDIAALADAVANAVDLSEIRGIVVDDTAFSSRRFGPGYDAQGPGFSYMAPSGALSLQWNTVEIEVKGAAKGHPVRIAVSPQCDHMEIRSTAKGGRGALSAQTWAHDEHTVVDVRGHLRAGTRYTKRRRVNDPGRFTASAFAAQLQRHGAGPLKIVRGSAPPSAALVATHRSAPLPEVLESALAYSNNFTTEQVLRTLGWRMSGEAGDWNNGHRALERYWEAAGLPLEALAFENASGLSSVGRITAAALADLLAFAAREGSPAAALWSALPVAGREGTLRGRLRRSHGRVRAKTGTLRGASALSGVVEVKGGRRLGFSILVNGPVSARRSRRLQDDVVMALLEHGAAG
ncbi:MAG: D-alanyl-D-alanine carboxypeptidase/D-alanyl-D-alanine-endopeptidase [Deltaproteobacteria bacterium]|nr:D-alanyl-D-alanine carboxypeptidase/D-alanyl-D-alanine-endopeptidase [Deltaproteobacteria bacterium]